MIRSVPLAVNVENGQLVYPTSGLPIPTGLKPKLFCGDAYQFRFQILSCVDAEGTGTITVSEVDITEEGTTFQVGIKKAGALTSGQLLAYSNAVVDEGFAVSEINFATEEMAEAAGDSDTFEAILELQATNGGLVSTLAHIPVTILNDVIKNGAVIPAPLAGGGFIVSASDGAQVLIRVVLVDGQYTFAQPVLA